MRDLVIDGSPDLSADRRVTPAERQVFGQRSGLCLDLVEGADDALDAPLRQQWASSVRGKPVIGRRSPLGEHVVDATAADEQDAAASAINFHETVSDIRRAILWAPNE